MIFSDYVKHYQGLSWPLTLTTEQDAVVFWASFEFRPVSNRSSSRLVSVTSPTVLSSSLLTEYPRWRSFDFS